MNTQVAAQSITFEKGGEYARVGVYDTWEESPFRTGAIAQPERYVGLTENPDKAVDARTGVVPNPSATVLAVQRSRYGGNAFGVRIDLDQAFCLGTTAHKGDKAEMGDKAEQETTAEMGGTAEMGMKAVMGDKAIFVHVRRYKPEG